MPSFSIAPLSYVTQIGEHLFELPQQLEPFASGELQESDKGKEVNEDFDASGFIHQWISHVSRSTMSLYLQRITQIKHLTPLGIEQLIVDIGNYVS
jgi:conserved oligomeric Golgi complex subunit 7